MAKWDFVQNTMNYVANEHWVNSHDVQRAYGIHSESVWAMDYSNQLMHLAAQSGIMYHNASMRQCLGGSSVNHMQLIEEDTAMILSDRDDSAFFKAMLTDGSTGCVWQCGGRGGDFELVDIDGSRYPKGVSMWTGQHNAEYFGEGQYFLFDNGFNDTAGGFVRDTSRLLVVALDEDLMEARLEWEYGLDYQTMVFGDHDRLPTGNSLGVAWPYASTERDDFDMEIFEVERDTGERAWQLRVWGGKDGTGFERAGWVSYSVERLYDAPLVYNATCPVVKVVSFSAASAFKQSSTSPARYTIRRGGKALVSGEFDLAAHWRSTRVDAYYHSGFSKCGTGEDACVLEVTNAWGATSAMNFTCTQ